MVFSKYYIRNFGRLVFCGNLVSDGSAVLYHVYRASGGKVLFFDCAFCGKTFRQGHRNHGCLQFFLECGLDDVYGDTLDYCVNIYSSFVCGYFGGASDCKDIYASGRPDSGTGGNAVGAAVGGLAVAKMTISIEMSS